MTSKNNKSKINRILRIYRENRPWGNFIQYTNNQISTVKIMTVHPGEELSYQYHSKRDELWIPLTEGLEFIIEDQTIKPRVFEELFLPCGIKHRARGIGNKPGQWLEISFGEFDENDIIRLKDKYKRK